MVAPYEIGDPVRSFVRVPGSGTDKVAKPICWDLSRSSTVAGAAPVQQTLPSAIPVTTLIKPTKSHNEDNPTNEEQGAVAQAVHQTQEARQNSSVTKSTSENISANNEQEGSVVQPAIPAEGASQNIPPKPLDEQSVGARKRKAIVESGRLEHEESTVESCACRKIARVAEEGGESNSADNHRTNMSSEVQGVVAKPVSSEVSKLIKERDQLREENLELQKRLALFHDLFKNKKRLTMFVRRLGIPTN
nr:uncharacterized protein LOC123760007 [Procambarus clarkii]XP_045601304.1 uncharacterized protein LOC123760007 [Procambarus clarkii]XP_045601305.1 uncharacterized protein LOC123760007 [Procambarus clarkii]